MQSLQPPRDPEAHPDIHALDVDGRQFVVVGTAHISQESATLVREVIERERPDCVCLELDRQRYETLSNPKRWDTLDLKQLIRNRQLAPLVAHHDVAAGRLADFRDFLSARIAAAVAAIRKQPVEKRIDTGVVVVTKDNLESPEVQKVLGSGK